MPGIYYYALLIALILDAVNPTLGEEYSLFVRNGYPVEAFGCPTAGDVPHRWEAFRMEENRLGQTINITGFRRADGSLSFAVNTSTNTGYYLCLNQFNEHEIYDKYLVLTDDERLQVFITSVVWVNGTWSVTVTVMFTQFEGTPEIPKTFYVYFLPEGASESEKLKFAPILESRIENGVASLSFNTTENGTITAEAEFRVGLEVQNHRVTSNPVGLILELNPSVSNIEVEVKEGSTNPPGPSPVPVAGIVCGVLAVVVVGLGILCTVVIVYLVHKRKERNATADDNHDSRRIYTPIQESCGSNDKTSHNAQLRTPP